MADRFPLIVDSSAEQIQELSAGDNLDLTGSNLINANNIQTSDMNVVGVMTATKFKGDGSELDNLPAGGSSLEATASGTLADGDPVVVNTDGTVSAVVQSGDPYWFVNFGGGSYGATPTDIAHDSSGNVYVVAGSSITGSQDPVIVKYNASGVIQWQRTLGGTNTDYGFDIETDSSGNVYIVGEVNGHGQGGGDILIAKYNSSGTIQWQRLLGASGTDTGYGIATDSSGNVYISASTGGGGGNDYSILIAKYDTSGVIQWQRALSDTGDLRARDIVVDNSGYLYNVSVTEQSGQGNWDTLIIKYDTSGNLQWQRVLGASSSDFGYGIAVDSSSNVYVCGASYGTGAGMYDLFVAKYNSSGSIQWQRTLGYSSTNTYGNGVDVDSSGNVYVTGYTDASGSGNSQGASIPLIAKYDTSGTLQWQRTFRKDSVGGLAEEIVVDSSDNFYITGYISNSPSNVFIAKLPGDGSKTGGYSGHTYSASTLTAQTSSMTSSTLSLTASTPSFVDQSVSLTDASSSHITSTTTIAPPPTNLTAENYIGISDGAYTNGQTATIQLIGSVDDAQSSLTPGRKYYVQGDGTLSTTADSPSVLAGTAVATTKLKVKN